MFKQLRRSLHIVNGGLRTKKNPLHDLLLQMPKDRAPLLKVLKASRKLKNSMTGGGKYPAGIINLQVLGNGSSGGPKSIYLFTDQARYLFNCGEGTQRLAHEHKMKLARLEHVFVTNNGWGMIGGLPGVALTIQDIGIPELSIHGPRGLGSLFVGTRRFVILKDLDIKIVNGDKGGQFEDHVLIIEYVPLLKETERTVKKEIEQVEEDDVDYYASYRGRKGEKMVTVNLDEDEAEEGVESSLCYICQPKKKEGSLLIDKCIARGVPPGPLLGRLKAGQDITLPNGEIVKASDVTTPDCPGPKFLIVDCPDMNYLPLLLKNEKLKGCQEESFPYLVVHFTCGEVMLNPAYIEWMGRFRISTQHLVLNELCVGSGSEAVHRLQTKLGVIDQGIFPPLREFLTEAGNDNERSDPSRSITNAVSCVTMGETLIKYCIRPITDLDCSSVVGVTTSSYLKETEENEEFKLEVEKFKSVNEGAISTNTPSKELDYPQIIFFGTGSSIPNKTRNVSSFMLRVNENKSILLDCGEGTCSQLSRFYGGELDSILLKIRVIYVSHLHADHHMGLVGILLAREKAAAKASLEGRKEIPKVYLIAPYQIQTWLNLFDAKFERIRHLYELVWVTDFKSEFLEKKTTGVELSDVLASIDCSEILTDYVRHCPNAFGVSFKFKFDWKFTYSGDTMPSENLIKIGKGSDLLVHEATMEDELEAEARIKMHSTVSEAVRVGKDMGAKFTILTHFSQRYAKVPLIKAGGEVSSSGDASSGNVGVAFDNMVIRVRKDLGKIGSMYGVLKALFSEDCDEMEVRSAKRRRKREIDAKRLESAN